MTGLVRLTALVGAAGLLAIGLSSAAMSASKASPAIVVTGTLPRLPAPSAMVLVEVERHADLDAQGVAQRLVDTVVARQTVTSPAFSVAVPPSPAITQAEINGEATFVVIADRGNFTTLQEKSVAMTPQAAQGNPAALAAASSHTLAMSPFSPWEAVPAARHRNMAVAENPNIPPPPPCHYNRYRREKEGLTRISEFHLTKVRGLRLSWEYGIKSDTTMSVGFSDSPAMGYTAEGTFTATNSIGSGSGFSKSNDKVRRYIDGQAYWQRYRARDSMACPQHDHYKNTLDHMVGTSLLGPHKKHHRARHPKANPYGGCLNDPHGQATVVPGNHFRSDRGRDVMLSGAATIFGFTFTASTGFTNDIHHNYRNHSRIDVYVCGTSTMPDVPILYNDRV